MRLLPVLLVLACADLPEGWEDAEPVDDLVQSACEGSPYDTDADATEVRATASAAGVAFAAEPLAFRCAQAVEGFWKPDGDGVAVLVQPRDMHPDEVAGCDCLYRVAGTVPVPGATHVQVWRRWDALDDPNPPVRAGGATVGE